jgi:hypothetical protein
MHPSQPGEGEGHAFWLVLRTHVERAYDPLTVPRETLEFSVHLTDQEGVARLLAELEADMEPCAALSLRRSHLLRVDVPEAALREGCPRRWVSDRPSVMLGRCGAAPGEWARAVTSGRLAPFLGEQLAADLGRLADAALHGAPPDRGGVAALAMRAAGAVARAKANGAIEPRAATRALAAARAIGMAAWEGGDTARLARGAEEAMRSLGVRA